MRHMKIFRTENDETCDNAAECQQPAEDIRQCDVKPAPKMVHDEQTSMQAAPDDIRPASTMPEADDQHAQEKIAQLSRGTAAAAPERDVEVVLDPEAERHMPAPPEINNGTRLIRRIEIQRELQINQEAKPDGHFAITGEVEIKLQGIAERTEPGFGHRQRIDAGIDIIDPRSDLVRNQDFLCESEREDCEPGRHVVPLDVERALC